MKLSGVVENYKILQSKYEGSWRKMWLLRPRVRTDGKICLHKFSSFNYEHFKFLYLISFDAVDLLA